MAVAAHDQLVAENAKWIARATVLANQQPSEPHRDTEASRERAAVAAAVKRKLKAAGMTSKVKDQSNGIETKVRAIQNGGRSIEQIGRR